MRSLFVPRILALWLSISLAVPSPALALRPVGLEEANPGVREEVQRALGVPPGHPEPWERTGLEEPTSQETSARNATSKLRKEQVVGVVKGILGLRRFDQWQRFFLGADKSNDKRIASMAARRMLIEFFRFYEEQPGAALSILKEWLAGQRDSALMAVRERVLETRAPLARSFSTEDEEASFTAVQEKLRVAVSAVAAMADPENDIVKMLGPVFEKFKDVDLVTPYAVANERELVRALIEAILDAYGHRNARYYFDEKTNIRYSSWGRHIERVPSSVRALVAVRLVYYTDDVERAVASKLLPILEEVRDSEILQRELRGARFNNGSVETIAREILNAFGHARDELLGARWNRPIEEVPNSVRVLPALLDEFEKAAKWREGAEAESKRHRQTLEEFTQFLLAEVDRRLPAVQPTLLPLGSSRFLEEMFGAGATQEGILARYSVMTDAQRDQLIAFVVGYRDALPRLSYRARGEAEDFLFRLIQFEFTDSRQPGTLARALVVRDKSRRMAKAVSSLIAGLDLPVEMRVLYEDSRSQGRLLKQHAAQERAAEQIREARALAEAIEELNQSLQSGESQGSSERALPSRIPQLPAAGSDAGQTLATRENIHREEDTQTTSSGMEEAVSVEEFERRFPGVAVPEGVQRVYLVPGKEATTIHIYAHDTLLSELEKVASQESAGLPEGLKVEVLSLPSSVDVLGQPGLIAQDWLLGLPYVQALLPVLKMAAGEKPPSLSSLVLYALRGQAGQVEAVVGVMTLQDAQGQTLTAYFV